MWANKKGNFYLVDSKIVREGFIVAEANPFNYGFLHKENTPFEKDINSPVFHIFKVHKNHPMRVLSANSNHIDIWPANEEKKSEKNPRTTFDVVEDKMDYDLTTFFLLPFEITENPKNLDTRVIEDSFIPEGDDSSLPYEIKSIKQPVSLFYSPTGVPPIFSQNILKRVSEVMPSQVVNHFYHWLNNCHDIHSHDQRVGRELEGRIRVPVKNASKLIWEFANILEDRYNTRLMHENYRRYGQDVEKGFRN